MRLFCLLIVAALAACPMLGQMQYAVSTDKLIYNAGDDVSVTITATNPGDVEQVLKFASCYQAGYEIDAFDWARNLAFCQAITYRSVPPHGSTSWEFPAYPLPDSAPKLGIGLHAVTGKVGGYWTSEKLWINVVSLTDAGDAPELPAGYFLEPNFPNPFNPATTIAFGLPRASDVSLKIFNPLGEEVAALVQAEMDAGTHRVRWDASRSPSGVYFCRLLAGPFAETRRILLLR